MVDEQVQVEHVAEAFWRSIEQPNVSGSAVRRAWMALPVVEKESLTEQNNSWGDAASMGNKRRILICIGAAIGGATMTLLLGAPIWGQFKTKVAPSAASSTIKRTHRVIIQVTQNDAAVMTLALNNADNLVKYYQDKGEKIQIEFVAFGAGLNMLRSDTSPVRERVTAMSGMKYVTFSGCGNTLANQSRAENKRITLVPEAHLVAAGIARVVELQEQGWSYVRP